MSGLKTRTPGRILVVEDEPFLRQLVVRKLEGAGFEVLEAPNGAAALRALQETRAGIALVITDVVMPHMDGFELANQVTQRSPATKVLLISGEADRFVAVRGGMKETGYPFLLKPFTLHVLMRAIETVLVGKWTPALEPEQPADVSKALAALGTDERFRAPVDGAAPRSAAPTMPAPSTFNRPIGEAPTVLVVDDEPPMRRLMMRCLDGDGC